MFKSVAGAGGLSGDVGALRAIVCDKLKGAQLAGQSGGRILEYWMNFAAQVHRDWKEHGYSRAYSPELPTEDDMQAGTVLSGDAGEDVTSRVCTDGQMTNIGHALCMGAILGVRVVLGRQAPGQDFQEMPLAAELQERVAQAWRQLLPTVRVAYSAERHHFSRATRTEAVDLT